MKPLIEYLERPFWYWEPTWFSVNDLLRDSIRCFLRDFRQASLQDFLRQDLTE